MSKAKVLVVGMAKSGLAAAHYLAVKGYEVVIADAKIDESLEKLKSVLESEGILVQLGGYPEIHEDLSFIVVSPGVPLDIPPLVSARELGVKIISEIELAFKEAKAPIVAITGTNGKTTTTSLIGQIFKDAEYETAVTGNIGLPMITQVDLASDKGIFVVEVSSFQLETTETFAPTVAVVLNITPDHLDRHKTLENYILAKEEIFLKQKKNQFTVLNYDDEIVRGMAKRTKAKVIFFSRKHKLEEGVFVEQGKIKVVLGGNSHILCSVEDIFLPGAHNLENALAAVAAAVVMEVPTERIVETLKTFQGVAHRLERVAEINGVTFINDSKGTNPDASIKALEAYDKPMILIAGGKNKGSDFSEFASKMKGKVSALVLLGQAAPDIADAARKEGIEPIVFVESIEEAAQKGFELANPSEIVLLSPACASWDMFTSYEERGDRFKRAVLQLQ